MTLAFGSMFPNCYARRMLFTNTDRFPRESLIALIGLFALACQPPPSTVQSEPPADAAADAVDAVIDATTPDLDVDANPSGIQIRGHAIGVFQQTQLWLSIHVEGDIEGDVKGGIESQLLNIFEDGTFAFPERLPPSVPYTVTVVSPSTFCSLHDAAGIASPQSPELVLVCGLLTDISVSDTQFAPFEFSPAVRDYYVAIPTEQTSVVVSAKPIVADVEITMRIDAGPPGDVGTDVPLKKSDIARVALAATHTPTGLQVVYTLALHRGGTIVEYAHGTPAYTDAEDALGRAIALSRDGHTLAMSAPQEDGDTVGINGDESGNNGPDSGAVYVFRRTGLSLTQEAYIRASNADFFDRFGDALALSADGNTLAVAAEPEDGAATGIDGDQSDDSANESGAVYVFRRTGSTWTQDAYVKASNTDAQDRFGNSLALSDDGTRLFVGSSREASGAAGIDGDQTDNSAARTGAVYAFRRIDGVWAQTAYLKASNPEPSDSFGISLAVSDTGDILVVGAVGEDSSSAGIDGNEDDNSAQNSGAAYVFVDTTGTDEWAQRAYLKASHPGPMDFFGANVALDADGDVLAVSTEREDSAATGINGDQTDDSADSSGVVYVFHRTGDSWQQAAYIKASNTDVGDRFGRDIALDANGTTLVVGAPGEDSGTTLVHGDKHDNTLSSSGAVYMFDRTGDIWMQTAYIKTHYALRDSSFGNSVTVGGDTRTLAVSAPGLWVNGATLDDMPLQGTAATGSVHVFRY